ncbi:MAG: hypothetical protein ACR2IV_05640 [Bryobacteraceae bacterium]
MAAIKLSTGIVIQSEHIQQVEYYPGGSLWISSFVNGFEVLRDQDFLYIRTTTEARRITGRGAAEGADAIEQAGVRVYRRPMPAVLDVS